MTTPGLEIIFSDGYNELSLFYLIYEWRAAQTFYELIKKSKSDGIKIYSDTSFNITQDDESRIICDINNCIEKMNEQYNLKIKLIETEADLNNLHRESTPVNCDLWRVINDRIHAYEQYKTQQNFAEPRVNAYFRFETNDSVPLKQEDFLFFKADREYGDLCMNYTYKGKHWLEVQSDNDIEALTDGQLTPEDRIAPTGYLLFRPPSPTPFYRLNKFVNWFKTVFPDKEIRPDLAIGYLLVGKLVMPSAWNDLYVPARAAWTKQLCNYKTIKDIKIIDIDMNNRYKLMKKSRMYDAAD